MFYEYLMVYSVRFLKIHSVVSKNILNINQKVLQFLLTAFAALNEISIIETKAM